MNGTQPNKHKLTDILSKKCHIGESSKREYDYKLLLINS